MELRWLADDERPNHLLQRLCSMHHTFEAEFVDPDPPVSLEWMQAELHPGNATSHNRFVIGETDDDIVSCASIETWNMSTNGDVAECWIAVDPRHRRSGYGKQLVAEMLDEIERLGRTSLLVGSFAPASNFAFWKSLGAPHVYDELLSRCDVTRVDQAQMQSWSSPATGYRLESWEGLAPPEFTEGMDRVRNAINDAPTGTMDIEDFDFDAAWIEGTIAHRNELGMQTMNVAAIHNASEQPVGHTELIVEAHRPWHAWQGDTAVLPEHRGHGLGRLMKAAMWQRLRAVAPDVTTITTGNASDNEHMLAINIAMGFKPWRVESYHQAKTADLRRRL